MSNNVPKVLVLSNECFSKTSSNGRTLGNFFINWPKEKLAQFFLTGQPDEYYCWNFYQVSDKQVINAILRMENRGGKVSLKEIKADSKKIYSKTSTKKYPRNALTMIARNILWKYGQWEKNGYWDWVKQFNPDIVLLQAGDCAFMYDLAVKTIQNTNAKLVIYNSEGYYYKNFDYFRARGLAHLAYPIFHNKLKKSLEKAYKKAQCTIYICDEIKKIYEKDFKVRAETIYTGSEVKYEEKKYKNKQFTTVYCGNLGLKRHESLIEIADTLQSINKNLYLDVYGKASSIEVKNALKQCIGIKYHGLVSYDEVKRLLRDSDLLLYVESFDDFYKEDTKFGFSTKIADSLSSGNTFLVYAPEHFICYQYIKNNQAAFTVSNKQELKEVLYKLITDSKLREKYKFNALNLAKKNHSVEINNKKFQEILKNI